MNPHFERVKIPMPGNLTAALPSEKFSAASNPEKNPEILRNSFFMLMYPISSTTAKPSYVLELF